MFLVKMSLSGGEGSYSLSLKAWSASARERVRNASSRGFTAGSVVKNPPASAGDMGSIPDLGRSHVPWSDSAVYHNY